jgi:hypothetical protein
MISQRTVGEDQEKDDKSYFGDFHKAILDSVVKTIGENKKSSLDIISKNIGSLRGVLAPYLSTPLTSDKGDIERAIKDNYQQLMEQLGSVPYDAAPVIKTYSVMDVSQVPLHRQIVGVIRRLLKNGKIHLADAGVSYGKNSGSVFITQIGINDFSLLPAVYAAARSYRSETPSAEYAVLNDDVGQVIDYGNSENRPNAHMIHLQWDGSEYLFTSVQNRAKILSEQFGVDNILLTKKSFFGGFGSMYQFQCSVDLNKQALGSLILSLVGDDAELEDAITTHGSLLVLETMT